MDTRAVLEFIASRQAAGMACVLVTVCAVEGSSMRDTGSIMGVAGDGSFAGSLSGGCIENAVVAEAADTLAAGAARMVRFGAGSPYLDIRLPCGGGLDLHFAPLESAELATRSLASLAARAPFAIEVGPDGARHVPQWCAHRFDPATGAGAFGHWPEPHLVITGHGAGVEALSMQARTLGCEVQVLTPDERIVERLTAAGEAPVLLTRRTDTQALAGDRWSAFVFLFHDHDWEIEMIARALDLPHFYIGAMGGRRAHAFRCEALAARGVSEAKLATIRAPIGLFHSSRDPQTLALSTLAEVIRAWQDADFG